MTEAKRTSLVKPTLQTHFHIDFDWWAQRDNDWRIHLQNTLCPEHQKAFSDFQNEMFIDWVDPDTAEVQQVDGLQHIVITHCAKEPGFITNRTAMVDAVFRLFLANGNDPLTPVEIAEKIGRSSNIVLLTFAGNQVYRGIRPMLDR